MVLAGYKQQAQAYLATNQPLVAIQTYQSALALAQTLPDQSETAKLYEGMARAQQRAGQNAAAAGNYEAAAKLWTTLSNSASAANAMKNAANNYATAKNQAAFDIYKQALDLAQQAKDPALSAEILKSQGDLYQKSANSAAALTSYQQALEQAGLAANQEAVRAQLLTNIGQIQQNSNAIPDAINSYVQALDLWQQVDPQKERPVRNRLWLLYLATNRYDDALAVTNLAVGFSAPQSDAVVKGTVEVQGLVMHPQFDKWQLDLLVNGDANQVTSIRVGQKQLWGTLARVDTTLYANGKHVLRLRVVREGSNYDEYFLPITVSN